MSLRHLLVSLAANSARRRIHGRSRAKDPAVNGERKHADNDNRRQLSVHEAGKFRSTVSLFASFRIAR
jgi:hypothetical protein